MNEQGPSFKFSGPSELFLFSSVFLAYLSIGGIDWAKHHVVRVMTVHVCSS